MVNISIQSGIRECILSKKFHANIIKYSIQNRPPLCGKSFDYIFYDKIIYYQKQLMQDTYDALAVYMSYRNSDILIFHIDK